MANPDGETEDREEPGRDWVSGLVRALLAIYLLPALLIALAVGGLLLAVQTMVRLIRAIGAGRPRRPRSGGGSDPHCVRHASHLGAASRQNRARLTRFT